MVMHALLSVRKDKRNIAPGTLTNNVYDNMISKGMNYPSSLIFLQMKLGSDSSFSSLEFV